MPFKFTTAAKAAVSQPTVADVQVGQNFRTDFGTIYQKLSDGSFLKVGNPQVPSHNEVRVKPASYFGSGSRSVTILGDLSIAL